MREFWHTLLHALEDTWPLLPWILLIYIVIELIESKMNLTKANRLGDGLGPLVGAATGLIPQCGFSVMAAKLFEKKYITVGTLCAIFLSTSDEAFIILLSSGNSAALLKLLAVKIAVGVAFGYLIDGLLRAFGHRQVCVQPPDQPQKQPNTVRDIFLQRYEDEQEEDGFICSCGKSHAGNSAVKKYLLYPLLHTLQVGFFILLVNFVLTAVIHGKGEAALEAFMQKSKLIQPLITSLVGLIPNCASSVVLTEAYLGGGIAFGSCAAGLCANAGMGFVVLLKNVKKWKRNLALIGGIYLLSVVIGLICNLLPF